MPDRKRQTAKTPAQAFSETINPLVRDRVGLEDSKNRALQKNIKGKDQNDFTIGIKDIDESIVFYFDEVIKPTVLQNGKKKNVPVIYGNQERWKAVQKDGFYRDKNGKIQAPLIMFRRETLEKNRNLGNKLGAENPYNYVIFEKKYGRKNVYDRLSALTNRQKTREYQGVVVPDYVTLTYSCMIFTDYIEQNNKLIESINYASDNYWGDPSKFKFRAMIDSYSTTTDVTQGQDRITRTTFNLTMNGYIIPDSINAKLQGNRKFFSKSQVLFNFESTTSSEDLGKKVEKAQRKTGTRFYDNQVSRIATTLSDGTSMTTEQINYLTLNNTAIANTISSASATFNNKTIATAPDNFTLGQEAFAVYVNNTYIPNDQRTVAQDSSNIVVTFVTNDIGYLLESTDEVVIVGKFS